MSGRTWDQKIENTTPFKNSDNIYNQTCIIKHNNFRQVPHTSVLLQTSPNSTLWYQCKKLKRYQQVMANQTWPGSR